jgi:hypothetical protein
VASASRTSINSTSPPSRRRLSEWSSIHSFRSVSGGPTNSVGPMAIPVCHPDTQSNLSETRRDVSTRKAGLTLGTTSACTRAVAWAQHNRTLSPHDIGVLLYTTQEYFRPCDLGRAIKVHLRGLQRAISVVTKMSPETASWYESNAKKIRNVAFDSRNDEGVLALRRSPHLSFSSMNAP